MKAVRIVSNDRVWVLELSSDTKLNVIYFVTQYNAFLVVKFDKKTQLVSFAIF